MSEFLKRLKESRTLWAYVVGLFVILVRVVWPEFPVSDEIIEPALLVLGTYIMAEGLEGFRPAENILKTLWESRKFKSAVGALVVIFSKAAFPEFPFTEEQVMQFIYFVMAIILGLGVEGSAISGFGTELLGEEYFDDESHVSVG